jgi:hypothetical protein
VGNFREQKWGVLRERAQRAFEDGLLNRLELSMSETKKYRSWTAA